MWRTCQNDLAVERLQTGRPFDKAVSGILVSLEKTNRLRWPTRC